MNVNVQELAPCKKLVRIEVEAQKVDQALDSILKEFQKEANFPGFRPGKAPREMVERKYGKDIETEAKRKLISEAYKEAIEEKFDVVASPDIEEIQFGRGQPLQFAATIETAPEFELPVYKGLPARIEARPVNEADVQHALDLLREQHASFKTVERPVQTGDIAVVNYTGTSDGKPLTEIAPTAKGLTEHKGFWVDTAGTNSFIPGFAEQLLGAKAGEKRTVQVEFPADFVTPQLAGKKATYDVELVEAKEKVLAPLDDAFAKSYNAESLEKLKEKLRSDLENEIKFKRDKAVRNQVIRALVDRVQFELPDASVAQQTRNVVYEIVQENTRRGISRDLIEKEKDKIYSAATSGAKERVKVAFLLRKIAEKEDIKVSEAEIANRINSLAAIYQIPPQLFAKDLQKRNGLIEIFDQIMNEKVIDLLQQNAAIEEVQPAAEGAPVNPS